MNCEIVQDLLPLYHDGVCSKESRAAVEEHLASCGACRRILADMESPLPESGAERTDGGAAAVEKIAREWKRGKWRSWLKGAAAALLGCALLAGLWLAATELFVFPVPMERIQLTDVRQLSDGRVLYHFYIDDDRALRVLTWEFDEAGNVYYLPRRALWTERRMMPSMADEDRELDIPEMNGWARANGIQTEIVRAWYGQGADAILLWEEGQELPAASRYDEERCGFDTESAEYWAGRQR